MKVFLVIKLLILLATAITAQASEQAASGRDCPPGFIQTPYSSGMCSPRKGADLSNLQEAGPPPNNSQPDKVERKRAAGPGAVKGQRPVPVPKTGTVVYFFWGRGCPHCEEERPFLDALREKDPTIEIRAYEVWFNRKNAALLEGMLRVRGLRPSGVPVTFVHDQVFIGFNAGTRASLEDRITRCREVACADPASLTGATVPPVTAPRIPRFGAVTTETAKMPGRGPAATVPSLHGLEASGAPLPVLTLLLAGMDSFNPCAFFVLLSLLGMLVHAQSRRRMLLIGGIFVFFSGLIYFMFMAAWLNLFLLMGQVAVITAIAGVVSIAIAGINIKDFFLFKRGVSLSIPDSAKPGLFGRMRKLLRSTSLASIILGTTALAAAANFYELLCTAGFPMVFTRILTLHNLSTAGYYLYLVLYNIVYVIPLSVIVIGFTFTLGRRKLSEWEGRVLKLMSGLLMLGLGAVLLVNPALLNSLLVSTAIVASALGVTLLAAVIARRTSG